ncbi:MAG: CHAT domain-containing tetratricopeptide repeat protein [Phenylobacterium sp.]|nr:CHAT domain-containing tetratricopeptide repeat protein [Phenylobacterium sp.]
MRPASRRAGVLVGAALIFVASAPTVLARPPSAAEQATWNRLVAQAEQAQAAQDWRKLERASRSRAQLESRLHGVDSSAAAASWSWVGQALAKQRRDAKAEPHFRKAHKAALASLGPGDPQTMIAGANHAAVLERLNRFAEAEPLRRTLLDVTRTRFGPQSPEAAAAAAALADTRRADGRPTDAEPLYRLAYEIALSRLGDGDPGLADDLSALAAVLDDLGRHSEAEPLHRRALALSRIGEENAHTARAYAQMAANLDAQGRSAIAEPLHRRAVAIAEGLKSGSGRADYSLGLGINLLAQDRAAQAEPILRRSLRARQAAYGKRSVEAALAEMAQGDALVALGRGRQALRLHRAALKTLRVYRGDAHPMTARAYAALGASRQAHGDTKGADPLLRKALEIRRARLGEHHPLTARAYDVLAQNEARRGATAPAEVLASRAVAIVRERAPAIRRGSGAPAWRSEGVTAESEVLRRYLGVAWDAARRSTADLPRIQESAFLAAQDLTATPAASGVANRAVRANLPLVQARAARVGQDLTRQARMLESRLLDALPTADPTEPARIGAALDAVAFEVAALDRSLGPRNSPAPGGAGGLGGVSIGALQQRLRAGEGVLLVTPAGDDVHVFAISRTRTAWLRVADARAETEARVRHLRCQVDDSACPPGAADDGLQPFDHAGAHGLYADLIAPVEGALEGVSQLYVSADGPLASLPLGMAVVAPPSGDRAAVWLADRYAITVLPSVASLRATPPAVRRPDRPWTFAGFGAPNLGSAAPAARRLADPRALHSAYGPLPGTEEELRSIARVLGSPRGAVRLGDAATEAALKTSDVLARARVVAIATHGILSNEIAGIDEPGLVLTPPREATPADDGVLTASEAAALHLQADWVILSACNTAGPDGSPGGRSLSGLANAFLHAGARALMVSHWRVYDDATSALTARTIAFQRADPGLTRAESLQLAMRTIRTGRLPDGEPLPGWRSEWAHPAYWAPFVVIATGD